MAKNNRVLDMVFIGLFAALMAVCSWISIPYIVPFTLQTFGVYTAVGLLGGKRGTLSVIVYVLMGAVGLPVFAGFSGGIGAIFTPTGGYIIGFIATALVYLLVTKLLGDGLWQKILGMALGTVACYSFGTAWFIIMYSSDNSPISIMTALGWCVFPFIIPDMAKIAVSLIVSKMVSKHVKVFN